MARPLSESLPLRRRRILDAAGAALIKQGYHSVRLEEIATRAGISKGALYLYFKDKEDLFAGVLRDLVDQLEERLNDVPKTGSSLSTLTLLASVLLDFVDTHQDFLTQFTREKPDLCGKKAGKILQERFGGVLDQVARLLRVSVKEGKLGNIDTSLGSIFFLSLVRMFLLRKIVTKSRTPLRHNAEELMDLLLHGLGKKGRST